MMTYADAVRELEARGVMPDRPPSLEPMREALKRIDARIENPERVLIVAGTNGKGSVAATLDALFADAGVRVGLYTSPHLCETTERIRIAGADVSRELFCRAHAWVAGRTQELRLSHFEMLTAMAAWIFLEERVEWMILEVGLGGVWDATNAIPHGPAIITQLGLDHQNLLGRTQAEIARNKFGVITEGGLVVHAELPFQALEEAKLARERTESRWQEAAPFEYRARGGRPPEFRVRTPWGEDKLALPGARGAANAALALTAFSVLGFDPAPALARGVLSRVRWPGRMQAQSVPGARCPVYFSGDHNPQGIRSLLELLPFYERRRLHLLVGIGQDKDADEMLAPLFDLPDCRVHLTATPFRGRPLEGYGPEWRARAASADADPAAALRRLCAEAEEGDLIVVTGSLYLVGKLLSLFTATG